MFHAVLKGIGSYLPEKILTNDDLSKMVETNDAWITERTGIKQRHIAAEGEKTSDLAYQSAVRALENAGMKAQDIDLIVLATTSPDESFPATAVKVQAMLGNTTGFAFDVQAVCSGFLYALSVANSMTRDGSGKTALVIGAETISRLVDWTDRGTCVLFGDGAGAIVLARSEEEKADGVLDVLLYSDGRHYNSLKTSGGISSTQTTGFIQMQGQEVYKQAVHCLSNAGKAILEKNGLTSENVDYLVPHQANVRIIDSVMKKLGIPENKTILTLDKVGNTSASSIPIALDDGFKSGKIKKGDLLLLVAMGGGFTWGSCLLRY